MSFLSTYDSGGVGASHIIEIHWTSSAKSSFEGLKCHFQGQKWRFKHKNRAISRTSPLVVLIVGGSSGRKPIRFFCVSGSSPVGEPNADQT
jgi:hypothetical protein